MRKKINRKTKIQSKKLPTYRELFGVLSNYFNSAKYFMVLTIWLVYEFSLSYQETT